MKQLSLILSFIVLVNSYCVSQATRDNRFKIPVVLQNDIKGAAELFCSESLNSSNPRLVGQFNFQDTVYFNGPRERRDSLKEEQYLWEVKYFDYDHSLSSDGLQIIADYNTSIIVMQDWPDSGNKKYYYPIYIVNETSKPKVFIGKDSKAFAIQEAIDTADFGRWHPIESIEYSFCGNGIFRRKVNPSEFLMFLVPKYSGKEKTLLRIRCSVGENIIISNSYEGYINPKQFNIDKKSWINSRLKESKGRAYHWLFYDGVPKGLSKY